MNILSNTPKIGAGIIAIDIKTGDILLGRRGYDSFCPNCFSPFGGTFELKDGNPKETAKREFREESGYDGDFEISKGPIYINKSNHLTFYTYIGLIDGKFSVKIDPKESLGFGWYPIDSFPSNLLPGFKELMDAKGSELRELINRVVHKPETAENEPI